MNILKAFYTIITSTLSIAFILKVVDSKANYNTGELIVLSFLILICLTYTLEGITMGIKDINSTIK